MQSKMKKILLIIILLAAIVGRAQQTITIENAIDTALIHNFDIRIARNNTEISRMNNSFGMAGGLPTVGISATDNQSLYNLHQKLNSGVDINKDNVSSSSFNTGLSASMVLFNGFKIMATKEKLEMLQNQSEIQLNLQIENTIASIMMTWYDILRQQSYLSIMKSSLEFSAQKSAIINNQYQVGMANEADLLQAQMDLSLAEQLLTSQKVVIGDKKINLLALMGVKEFYSLNIQDTILIDNTIRKDSVLAFLERNPEYMLAAQQVKINEQIVKELRAQRYPSLKISTGYNFIYNSSSAGFNLFTQNYGPVLGASMQIPIFNGTQYSTQQHIAAYQVKNAEIEKESLLNSLQADVIKTYQAYETALQQLDSQKTNYENAAKLVGLVMQRFRLSQATILEVKAAQDSFERAGYQLVSFQYAAKVAEIELKRLTYRLGL
jgi:outer membrane protein